MSEMLTMTLRLSEKNHKTIAAKAKRFGLSQGEVIELLIEQLSEELDAKLTQAKESKTAARVATRKLAKLSPEQLAKLMELVE